MSIQRAPNNLHTSQLRFPTPTDIGLIIFHEMHIKYVIINELITRTLHTFTAL